MRNSIIIIADGIKLDKSHKNILNYTTNQMLALLGEHEVAEANNFSFIRSRGTISTDFYYSDVLHCNYMAFQNPDYDNKWFFAFIDEAVYISDRCTEIRYTIDNIATWWDDFTVSSCYVEREHINEDYIGASRTAENIGVDNYIVSDVYDIDVTPNRVMALFTEARKSDGTYVSPAEAYADAGGNINTPFIDNMPIMVWRVPFDYTANAINQFVKYYGDYVSEGKGGDLIGVFTYNNKAGTDPTTAINVAKVESLGGLGGYTPKNKKMLQYPFVKLTFTNQAGSVVELKQEDFVGNITMKVTATANDRGVAFAYPSNYKGLENNTDCGLIIDNYPTFPMTVDSYSTYIAQHEVSNTLGAIGGAVGTITTLATGNVLGAIAGLGAMASQIGHLETAKTIPDSVVGRAGGNLINFKLGNFQYLLEVNTITSDVARTVDDFYTRYGYSTNKLKVPNITGRPYFNYVKIGYDSNIGYGNIPSLYMEEINNVFRGGVTVWHNHATLGDYSVDNSI